MPQPCRPRRARRWTASVPARWPASRSRSWGWREPASGSPASSPTPGRSSRSTTASPRPPSPTRLAELDGRPVRLLAGPEVDPASAWSDAALVAFSPSITPGFPTTEPRLRAALDGLAARLPRRRPGRAGARLRAGPDASPVPRADDRRHRDEGQDDHGVAHRASPRGRPGAPGGAGREHRPAAHRPGDRADAGPPRRPGALRAAAAEPDARDDRGGLHERHRRPPRPPRVAGGVPRGEATAGRAGGPGGGARPQPRRPGRRRLRGSRDGARRSATGSTARFPAGWGSWTAGWSRRAWSGCRSPAAAPPGPGRPAGSCRSASSRCPGATTSRTCWRPSRSGSSSAWRRTRSGRAAATFAGVEHRLEPVGLVDGVRFVNDSQGTQPDAVAAALRSFDAAARPHRRRARQGRRPPGARPGRRGTRGRGGPDRRVRAGLATLFRAAGLRRVEQAGTLDAAVPRADALARELLADAAPGAVGHGAPQPGGRQLRPVPRLRRARACLQGGRRTSRRRPPPGRERPRAERLTMAITNARHATGRGGAARRACTASARTAAVTRAPAVSRAAERRRPRRSRRCARAPRAGRDRARARGRADRPRHPDGLLELGHERLRGRRRDAGDRGSAVRVGRDRDGLHARRDAHRLPLASPPLAARPLLGAGILLALVLFSPWRVEVSGSTSGSSSPGCPSSSPASSPSSPWSSTSPTGWPAGARRSARSGAG